MDMIKYNTPQELFTAICNSIRTAMGINGSINHQDIPDKINEIGSTIINLDEDTIEKYNSLLLLFDSNTTILDSDIIDSLNISFYGNKILTTVNLPKCTSIKEYAFEGCTKLTTVNLPKCTSIKDGAFRSIAHAGYYETKYDSVPLYNMDLPECTFIGNEVFKNCKGLTTVNLPKCTSIGDWAFGGCANLTTVSSLNCTTIGEYAFWECTKLASIINLPKCTSIKAYTFKSCVGLTTINLPKCISIGDYAFNYCTNLTTLILSSDQIVHISNTSGAFYNTPIANGTGYIYVPDNLVDSYKTAINWSTYANQIKPLSELPSELKEEYGYE